MNFPEVIHIAYVDDHVAVRKGIISFLNNLGGIKVDIEANNGKELISQLELAIKLPDIIIIDINMPVMDGFETMKVVKERWQHMKALILTAFETELYIIQMIKLGCNGYLLKECHPDDIKQALKNIYSYGYYYSDSASHELFLKVRKGEIKLPHFTEGENEFLHYCCSNLGYSQIAEKMNVTLKVIEGYRDRLCGKLHVNNRISLAMYAVQFGFVQTNIRINPDIFSINYKKDKG